MPAAKPPTMLETNNKIKGFPSNGNNIAIRLANIKSLLLLNK